ncbi:GNAT family N-acetyltransferase [Lachnoclostridium sp. Marseille-P6806]|uniref:GNAT family N-acetyltransferase n=1 Tax=Lachnoclostridium sp. Marseille-P6806 TaxID=2364793 RepID=UPI0013EF524F|nr:GNAT family N-acetyltransferase [Lachnoclostridium sp. Marseille-P6806]
MEENGRRSGDMLTRLMELPAETLPEGVRIVRALALDKGKVLDFVRENFGEGWLGECEAALLHQPSGCYIAIRNRQVIGFACYDATAPDFFGPIGVAGEERGKGVGAALLVRTLRAMREQGYVYAVIGWVDDAAPFYRKFLGAEFIDGGGPEHSIFRDRIEAV